MSEKSQQPFNEDLRLVILDRLYEGDICLDDCGGHEDAATDIAKAIQCRFDVTAKSVAESTEKAG